MSEQKQEVLSHELLAAIGDYGHAKYRHDNDIITLGAWEDLITAIKVWNRSALAAKDARIAELEGLLREMDSGWDLPPYFQHCIEQLLRDSSRFTWDLQNPESLRTRIDDALSAQQQANPTSAKSSLVAATPSEDGQEVPEVVAFLMKPDFCEPYVSLRRDSNTFSNCEPLMTVSQHKRIVAAKDAEIAHLSSLFGELHLARNLLSRLSGLGFDMSGEDSFFAELEQLLASAVVVMPEALRLVEMLGLVAEKAFHLADGTQEDCTGKTPVFTVDGDDFQALSDALDKCDEEPEIGDAYVRDGWLKVLDRLRAMITPAVMVLPARKLGGNLPDYQWQKVQSYNAALDEVARLNRRAIPEGLLERVEHLLACPQHHTRPEYISAAAELRALLGKS